VFKPISYSSKSDTEGTKLNIVEYNAKRDAFCEGIK